MWRALLKHFQETESLCGKHKRNLHFKLEGQHIGLMWVEEASHYKTRVYTKTHAHTQHGGQDYQSGKLTDALLAQCLLGV